MADHADFSRLNIELLADLLASGFKCRAVIGADAFAFIDFVNHLNAR